MIFNQTVSGAADADWGNCNLDRRCPYPCPLYHMVYARLSQFKFEVGLGLDWSACCAFLMQLCQGANKFMWLNMRVCVPLSVSLSCTRLSLSL